MPWLTDALTRRPSNSGLRAVLFAKWNRKGHYYLGLYFLFFLWLFALSGLLLNHSGWTFAQFYPNRKISKWERSIQLPTAGSRLDQANAILLQLGTAGEIQWGAAPRDPMRLEFNVVRPGRVYQVQADLRAGRAAVTLNQYNAWGVIRGMHTFVGVSLDDPVNRRDWLLTGIWAASMDALAAGIVLLVLSGVYLWWERRDKRIAGLIALGAGCAICGLFIVGLRWMYR